MFLKKFSTQSSTKNGLLLVPLIIALNCGWLVIGIELVVALMNAGVFGGYPGLFSDTGELVGLGLQ